jgi:UPF0271 protein
MTVDINCDMGESFGLYKMGDDEGMMPVISVANVACGFHASDPTVMAKTVSLAKKHGVKVGAHPSLPDLQGFGRREMKMDPAELTNSIIYQVGALKAFLDAKGMPLNHIKPHGSLYGMAARYDDVANAVCDAIGLFGVPLYGMSGTLHEEVSKARGVPFVAEFYADLDYDQNGSLIITREHEAVDPARAAARVVRALKEGKVKSVQGPDVSLRTDIVCVHSDTPGAVNVAKAVRAALGELQAASA